MTSSVTAVAWHHGFGRITDLRRMASIAPAITDEGEPNR